MCTNDIERIQDSVFNRVGFLPVRCEPNKWGKGCGCAERWQAPDWTIIIKDRKTHLSNGFERVGSKSQLSEELPHGYAGV